MDIRQFVQQSLGQWRSQRSAHHLAFQHFEEVRSTIDIEPVADDDAEVIALCQSYKIDPATITAPFRMTWAGESDWDEDEELSGSTLLVPVPAVNDPTQGKLLRDRGYAETVPAAATFSISPDGIFTLVSAYDRAAAEEKIWFVTPNLRFRVSSIKTSDGKGVLTASFSSEVRPVKAE